MALATGTVAVRDLSAEERMQALYDTHAKPVYSFLLRLTFGERQAAEDLLQETMVRAWRKIEALNADIATLRPWLLTVARRVAIDAGRAKRARPAEVGLVDMTVLPSGDDAIERMLAVQTIKRAMARLTQDHRNVIIEVYFRERSAAEAAAVLGIPEGTVKSRTYHALRSLRAAMGATVKRQPE
ncbi:sigma-70 family RNA polymerase sigma factor [Micromonospora sp. NPDC023814]|uniref:sigma-70 family RNA polymerase sigma factor n=1 Tax=Micromonospora sp. NPDC023814 TaxID=3154596 RepID=UPI0033F8C786